MHHHQGHDYKTDVRCPQCSMRVSTLGELVECMRSHSIKDEDIKRRLMAVGLMNASESAELFRPLTPPSAPDIM